MLFPEWNTIAPYAAPPMAASLAIIPVFPGFTAKSALQTGGVIPSLTQSLRQGCKAAPTIGVIVGTQIGIQKALEKAFYSPSSFTSILASSLTVGTLSAPALAVFNGQTMGRTVLESVCKFIPLYMRDLFGIFETLGLSHMLLRILSSAKHFKSPRKPRLISRESNLQTLS
jgi:hypothetical protein